MSESNRRQILKAGAVAVPGMILAGEALASSPTPDPDCVTIRGSGPNADYFPNAVLTSHENRRALFYDDLLAGGKTVLLHFMSVAREAEHPLLDNLARVQEHLGERLGRDVFLYSLTADPEHDSPRALAELARRHRARPGWLFLTGEPADLELLRGRLFSQNGATPSSSHHRGHHGAVGAKDCSLGLARYGNESIGLWGACPMIANPEWIARRLSWVTPREPTTGKPRRKGPLPSTYRT